MPGYWKAAAVWEANGKTFENSSIHMRGDLGPHCADHRCAWVSGFLCDYPVGKDKTCDRPLCDDHAYEVGPDIHYCASHFAMWEEFRDAGGVREDLGNVVPYKELEPPEVVTFPPSEFIAEELAERGWTREEFAKLIDRSPAVTDALLDNRCSIRPHTAAALAKAFGTSAQMWLNLEAAYLSSAGKRVRSNPNT